MPAPYTPRPEEIERQEQWHRRERKSMALNWAIQALGQQSDWQLTLRAARDFLAFIEE